MIISKDAIGAISIGICLIQYVPQIYLTSIGKIKPHVFARLIWAITFGIACAAQYADQGGAGTWANGVSGFLCFTLVLVGLRHGKTYVTRTDWITFAAALLAIPAWQLTHNPFYAALWSTAIDLIGYVPYFRKGWHKPHEELIYSTILGCLKNLLGMLAMEHYSPTTMIYPIAIFTVDVVSILFLLRRRQLLKRSAV
jgi:hypothetical protein